MYHLFLKCVIVYSDNEQLYFILPNPGMYFYSAKTLNIIFK